MIKKSNSKLPNFFLIAIAISLLVITLSIAYYYISYLPKKDKQELNFKIDQMKYQEAHLNECLDNASQIFSMDWDKYCENLGESKNCSLPMLSSDRLQKRYKELKEDCFKQYSLIEK